MITFKQKEYSEYDAMRSLYVELMKYSDRSKFEIIDKSKLIPVLKGNSVVIERFVISTSTFGHDVYRMYLKIGAKAKLPDEVRLPGRVYDKRIGSLKLDLKNGIGGGDQSQQNGNNGQQQQRNNSETIRSFSNKNKNGGGGGGFMSTSFQPMIDLSYEVKELLGDAILYNKTSRSLVLEFKTIQAAIQALNILPFGLSYKIYLLDA